MSQRGIALFTRASGVVGSSTVPAVWSFLLAIDQPEVAAALQAADARCGLNPNDLDPAELAGEFSAYAIPPERLAEWLNSDGSYYPTTLDLQELPVTPDDLAWLSASNRLGS